MKGNGIMISSFIGGNHMCACILARVVVLLILIPCARFAVADLRNTNVFSEAASLMNSGKIIEAVQIYDDLAQKSRISRDIHKALYLKGVCLQALGKYQDAIACWNTLLTRYTNTERDDDALLDMGNLYALNLNQPKKAMQCYRRLINSYPRSKRLPEAQFQLGIVSYMTGDYRNAKTAFETVLRIDPQGGLADESRDWLHRVSTAQDSLSSKQATRLNEWRPSRPLVPPRQTDSSPRLSGRLAAGMEDLAQAEALQKKGEYEAALKAFLKIVKNNTWGPGYDRALFRLGECQAVLGREDSAVQSWRRLDTLTGLGLNCEYADDSLLARAEVFLHVLGKPDEALECALKLQTDFPQSDLLPKAEYTIGLVYFYRGELDKALVVFERQLAASGQSSKTHKIADSDALIMGNPPTGLERLIAACRGEKAPGILIKSGRPAPARAEALIRMGDMQFAAKEYTKAKRSYERAFRAVEGTESAAYALLQAGRCLNQMRQYRQALRCYDQFLTRYRQSNYAGDALLRAGVIHVGPLHDMKKGAEIYSSIIERYPNANAAEQAQYHLATLAYWKKDWEQALDLYRRVAETWPEGRYASFISMIKEPELQDLINTGDKRGP